MIGHLPGASPLHEAGQELEVRLLPRSAKALCLKVSRHHFSSQMFSVIN